MCSELKPSNKPEQAQILPFSFWIAWEPKKDRECGFMSPRWRSGCHGCLCAERSGVQSPSGIASEPLHIAGVKMGPWGRHMAPAPPHYTVRSGPSALPTPLLQNRTLWWATSPQSPVSTDFIFAANEPQISFFPVHCWNSQHPLAHSVLKQIGSL